jgi:hypothetical protein
MIIPIPNQVYSPSFVDGYIVLANTIPSADEFIKRCGAIDGYALAICRRIYADLYGNSLCLKREFECYYRSEYSSIAAFLRNNYELPQDFLRRATLLAEQYSFMFLYEPHESFLEGEEGLPRLQRFLGDDEQ